MLAAMMNTARKAAAKKAQMEKGMQSIGSKWAAHTAKVQKELNSGKRRVDD